MKKIPFLNDVSNYDNVYAECGFDSSHLSEMAVFAVNDNEGVYEELSGDGEFQVGMRYISNMLDEIDLAMIAENARSKYLTSLHHYQYLGLRGYNVKRQGINNRLKKLVKFKMLREFEIRREGATRGIRYYGLASRGLRIALNQNVVFHMGNRVQNDEVDNPETVKRILTANMVIIGLLRNGAAIDGFTFNETIRPMQDVPITDNCILRTQGMFWSGKDSIFLLEVVRSTPHAFRKMADKVQRYYSLVNNPNYLAANAHGHKAMPQLVICAESMEHAHKADAYLRSRDLWSESDTILYTHDMVFMRDTLRMFYELKEDGKQVWYSMPSRFTKQKNICA